MKQTPLTTKHRALGARMVDYAGYEMPVQYVGVLHEHLTVRSRVGLFDLSHMGEFELRGPGALATVDLLTTNDPKSLKKGEIQYTCLTKENGGIIDDILVYRTESGYFLVVNAANAAKDLAWIKEHLQPGTDLIDRTAELALIAVQGPNSAPLVEAVLQTSLQSVKHYTFLEVETFGTKILLSRTGYTGEDGFELYFGADIATDLWDELMTVGEKFGIAPIGLGARDTLRLEMRMPLYGNDIGEGTNPFEAGLGRFVKLEKGLFLGREALKKIKEDGLNRRLVAFIMRDKGIPRQGYPLCDLQGQEIGLVTSGTHSPSLDHPIGMGYVEQRHATPGNVVLVSIRKKAARAEIIKGRFLKK